MEKTPHLHNTATDSTLEDFLTEFARYLVAAGVDNAHFAEIARIAYYRAATEGARFRNRRVNQSAVAAITGLTRTRVRDYSQEEPPTPRKSRDRVANVIRGWITDPAFLTVNYVPKPLSFGRKNSPFNALVRKYGGDVPARSILREMVRKNCVSIDASCVVLAPKARRTLGQSRLDSLAQALLELLREPRPQAQQGSPIQTLSGEIHFPAPSRKGRILLQRSTSRSLRTLMAELQAAGHAASVESPLNPRQKSRTTRTRVVLISEDLNAEE